MEHFKEILRDYPLKTYQKGESILYQGEVPEVGFVVKSGMVRAYDISDHGDEKPLAFKKPYEIFPTAWLFKLATASLYFYEAYTPSELYVMPRKDFIRFADEDQAFMRKLLNDYVTSSVAKSLRINALQYSKAADKLLHIFEYLMVMYGKELKDGHVMIDLPIIQQELANLLGITRETTVLELSKLKKQGLVSQSQRKIIISKELFEKHIGESEFLDMAV